MRVRKVFLFLLVCFLLPFVFLLSCKKPTQLIMKDYEAGQTIKLADKSEIVVQNMIAFPSYKIPVSVESVKQFPFVYYQKNDKNYRIIKVKDDGSTVDTIIDGIDSPTYENGYIVEKSSKKKSTNSSYLLDVQTGELFPKNVEKKFVLVRFTIKSNSLRSVSFNPELFWFEEENKNKIQLDPILSETILPSAYPEKMEMNQSYEVALVGLIPNNAVTLYFVTGNARIKWEVKTN